MLTAEEIKQKPPEEIALLLAQVATECNQLKQDNALLRQRLNQLLQRQYGSRSEKELDHRQGLLFDEADVVNDEQAAAIEDADTTITVPEHQRKKGRKPLPKHFKRVQCVHDLMESEKVCVCGCALSQIGDVRSEQLEFIPATIEVIEHVRLKYACKSCEETIKLATLPKQPIPKSIATPGLLAHVLVSKFTDHLPFYRQESIFQRMGVDIVRGTMCQWAMRCADLLSPLVNHMHQQLLQYDIGYSDETVVQVLKEPDRDPHQRSYMWLFIGGPPDKRGFIYQYHPSRSHEIADAFWQGFKGYLHSDGYGGYQALFNKNAGIQGVHCWAHARRKFMDIIKTNKKSALAQQAVKYIAQLYKYEKHVKQCHYTADEVYRYRQKHAQAQLNRFKQWLDQHSHQVLPKSSIGNAINYCLKFWDNLVRYTEDGRLEIDNNYTERSIKPFVMGRKAWLFHDSVKGAQAGAIIYSLLETCKAHHVEPYAYLRYVLAHIPECEAGADYEKFLPYNIDKDSLKIGR